MKWTHKILGFLIVKPLFKLFFNLRISGLEHVKNLSGPLLIIGNHKFFLDSFAFGAAIPTNADIYPIRFMGETENFNDFWVRFLKKIGVVKLVYSIFGVFPAIRGKGLDAALKESVEILKNSGIILLYPEGRMVREDKIEQFKRGAPALALITKVKVLPVAFKINNKGFRKKYFVKFGPVFYLPPNLSYEQGADYMRNIIVDLYKSLR
jgi:1-acyl-sn-glycerol-3-phosphate acyltransferase